MFTISCFIENNNLELVEKLENLGYINCSNCHSFDEKYLIAFKGEYLSDNNIDSLSKERWVNCGTNEELFLAIAALRDDSDKNQWFVTEKEKHWVQWFVTEKEKYWVNQGTFMPIGSFIFSYVDNYSKYDKEVHKASVEELIQYFKNE